MENFFQYLWKKYFFKKVFIQLRRLDYIKQRMYGVTTHAQVTIKKPGSLSWTKANINSAEKEIFKGNCFRRIHEKIL